MCQVHEDIPQLPHVAPRAILGKLLEKGDMSLSVLQATFLVRKMPSIPRLVPSGKITVALCEPDIVDSTGS